MISPPHMTFIILNERLFGLWNNLLFGSVAASLFAYFESVFKNQIQSSNILLARSFHLAKAEE